MLTENEKKIIIWGLPHNSVILELNIHCVHDLLYKSI